MHDVIIVGAGPAGSAAAIAMVSQGWRVAVLEKDKFPRNKVCGEFLSPDSQDSLRSLGVYETIRDLKPSLLDHAILNSRRGRSLETALPANAWGISRFLFDHSLALAAVQKGVELLTETSVKGFRFNRGVYEVESTAGSENQLLKARSLIIACGRHSGGRLPPHTSTSKRTRLHIGAKCHYRSVDTSTAVALYFFPGGYCGINRVEGERSNVCLIAPYAKAREMGSNPIEIIETAARWNPLLGEIFSNGTPVPETACAVAPVDTRRRGPAWSDAPLVGDSAAMIPPLCGDGMAMAIESAVIASRWTNSYLRKEISADEWRSSYVSEWRSAFIRRLRIARFLQKSLDLPIISDLAVRASGLIPFIPRAMVGATRGAIA